MRWLQTPLVRFLVGGAAVFWLLHDARPGAEPVVVTAHDVDRLRLDYTRDTGRAPGPADEAALVEKVIEEELLFRQALAHGLDRNDKDVRDWLVEQMRVLTDEAGVDADLLYARALDLGLDRTDLVVRRILVQKMRLFVARAVEEQPGDGELAAFYAAHREEYRTPDRFTFWHVFLSSAMHGAAVASDAESELARLRAHGGPPQAPVRSGNPSPVPPHVVAQSPSELDKLFGVGFAPVIGRAPTGTWSGPVPSPFGLHLVWVEKHEQGIVPPFEAVRERVLERWRDERGTRRVADLVRDLKRRQPLRVESDAWRERDAS